MFVSVGVIAAKAVPSDAMSKPASTLASSVPTPSEPMSVAVPVLGLGEPSIPPISASWPVARLMA